MGAKKDDGAVPSSREWFESVSSSSRAAIVTHDTPDPDALGSALAVQWILRRKHSIESDIFHGGEVSHPQNRTMVNLLGISLEPVSKLLEAEDAEYNPKIVVDSNPKSWSRDGSGDKIKFDAYFDHHPKAPPPKSWAGHADGRSIGSCCTLLWSVINDLGLEFSADSEEDVTVATAMIVGIRTDTDEMSSDNTTAQDFEALMALHPFQDQKLLAKIINYPIPKYFFDMRREAYEAAKVEESVMVAGIGYLTPERRDVMPWLADDFSRRDGIETCVVFGIVDDHLVGVVRSSNPSVEIKGFLGKIFGPDAGGGKTGKGAASVSLGYFSNRAASDETKEVVWNAASACVSECVFRAATGT